MPLYPAQFNGASIAGNASITGNETIGGSLSVTGTALGTARPSSVGLLAWSFDPASVVGGNTMVAGRLYLSAMYVSRSTSVTTIQFAVATAATSVTAGANWAGLFDGTGNLLASVALDGDLTTTGTKTKTITSTPVTPGMYWVGFLSNASSGSVGLAAGEANSNIRNVVNGLASAASYRFAYQGTGLTTLSSITPGNNTTADTLTFAFYGAIG